MLTGRREHLIGSGTESQRMSHLRDVAEDQKVYRELVSAMNGVNVAEAFGKQSYRTCFLSEEYLKKNFGQRIDHVIAERSLLQQDSTLRISKFDTLIQLEAHAKDHPITAPCGSSWREEQRPPFSL